MDEKDCTQVDTTVVDVFFPQAKIFNITNIPDNQIFQSTTNCINFWTNKKCGGLLLLVRDTIQ